MVCDTVQTLVERDLNAIWHPFTQRKLDPNPLSIARAEGAYLYTEQEEAYLDAISSWWVNLHGHAHSHIAQAIATQSKILDQVLFTDFTHQSAIVLAEKLLGIAPQGLSKVFFSDNGSTAVECALKMAIQYWSNKKIPRRKIISLAGGYHGDTFGAMSVSGKNTFNYPFWPYLFEVENIDPFSEECVEQLKRLLAENAYACMIYEPLIQGASGMRIYPKKHLNALLKLCKEAEVILIADEVMTGFGRTGPLFASEYFEVAPDILCLSKGLTGGFLPMGATLAQEFIYKAFLSENRLDAFLHGHSYTANPVICAAATASLELLLKHDCELKREMIAKAHQDFCQKHQATTNLTRLESIGTILVLEFKGQKGYTATIREKLIDYFHQKKILLRPLGNVVYVIPPYCISESELNRIYQVLEELL